MTFQAQQFTRTGTIHTPASLAEVFPLLCPKREEEWIPGWQCETLWSHSGYNEEGAVFRTTQAYGVELYWSTLRYDRDAGLVDFLIHAPHRFLFRFRIDVNGPAEGPLAITMTQTFTSVSEEGSALLARYGADEFATRLQALEGFMNRHLGVAA